MPADNKVCVVLWCFEGTVSRNNDEVNEAIADHDTVKGQASKSRKSGEGYYCHGGG